MRGGLEMVSGHMRAKADLPLPLFDQDLESEQGMPENGARLKKWFIDHDGLLIAAPEYNSSITAVLKNAIDWVSRQAPNEPSPAMACRGKAAILMSASPGALGGFRGLVHVMRPSTRREKRASCLKKEARSIGFRRTSLRPLGHGQAGRYREPDTTSACLLKGKPRCREPF